MTEFSVFIDSLPPTSNQAYKVGRLGKAKGVLYMTEEGKAWKDGAQLAVQAANRQPEGFWKGRQLYVSLTFFGHSTLTYDIDGRVKLALDAVAAGLGFDDRYVFPLLLNKQKGVVPGVSVMVTDRIPHELVADNFTDEPQYTEDSELTRFRMGQELPDFTAEQVALFDKLLSTALQAVSGIRHELYISPLARERLGEAHEAMSALNDLWCSIMDGGGDGVNGAG